jgi:hypothetical protein
MAGLLSSWKEEGHLKKIGQLLLYFYFNPRRLCGEILALAPSKDV